MSTSFSHYKNRGFVPFCSGSAEVLPDPNLCPKIGRGVCGQLFFSLALVKKRDFYLQ